MRLSFAGSGLLAAQVARGAAADLLVTADRRALEVVRDAGLVRATTTIAHSRMTLLVERGNPRGLVGLADLARRELRVVLCDPSVPCGRLADLVLNRAGVVASVDSLEASVSATAAKVTRGEADVAIVYVATAVASGSQASSIPIPAQVNVTTSYPAAELVGAEHPEQARALLDLLTGPRGGEVLRRWGFEVP